MTEDAEQTEQTDEQAEQAANKNPTPVGALPAALIAKTPPINAGKKPKAKAEAAAPEPPADAFAIYERTGEAWALKKTYATQAGGVSAFQRNGLADEADEVRLVTRGDGAAFLPTLYGHEVEALDRIAMQTR